MLTLWRDLPEETQWFIGSTSWLLSGVILGWIMGWTARGRATLRLVKRLRKKETVK